VPYCSNCGTLEQGDQQFCFHVWRRRLHCLRPLRPAGAVALLPDGRRRTAIGAGPGELLVRVLGFVIDSLILAVVTSLPVHYMSLNFYVSSIATIVVGFFYWFLFISYWDGQTPGMKAVRIRCVNMDGRGAVDVRQSAVRSATYSVLLTIGSLYHFRTYAHPTTLQTHHEAAHELVLFALLLPHVSTCCGRRGTGTSRRSMTRPREPSCCVLVRSFSPRAVTSLRWVSRPSRRRACARGQVDAVRPDAAASRQRPAGTSRIPPR